MPFRLSSTEITLRKSGLRIGYDYIQAKHTLLLDADILVLTARPGEEGQGDTLTVQARLPYRFAKSTVDENTIIIHPDTAGPVLSRLESLSNLMALAGVTRGGEWHEENNVVKARLPAPVLIRVEPEHRHVIVYIGSMYRRRAEHLHLEARHPTLANILLDKIQAAVIFYTQPVNVEIESEGDVTRIRVTPSSGERLGATSKN